MFADLNSNPLDLNAQLLDLLQHPGKAFPSIVAIVLAVTAGVIVLHLVLALIGGRATRPRRRLNLWERLVYLGALVSVATLGFTAFFTILRFGSMRGWWLFAHMFGAGALVALLPLLAINWAGPCRFGSGSANDEETYATRFFWIPKLMFWLFLLSSLTVILTILLSMLPIFGTDGLHILLDIHRYAGLMAVVVLTIHFYCILLQRARLR